MPTQTGGAKPTPPSPNNPNPMTSPHNTKSSADQMLKEYLSSPGGQQYLQDMDSHMSNIRLMARRLSTALKNRGADEADAGQVAVNVIGNIVNKAVVEALDEKKATGRQF